VRQCEAGNCHDESVELVAPLCDESLESPGHGAPCSRVSCIVEEAHGYPMGARPPCRLVMAFVLFVIAVPLFLAGVGQVLIYVMPPAAFFATFAMTVWLGRRVVSRSVLHGVLIGVSGTLMYLGLTRMAPEPGQYLVDPALKVVGGVAGGLVLARQGQPATGWRVVAGSRDRPLERSTDCSS
jgi:hypothetical protein